MSQESRGSLAKRLFHKAAIRLRARAAAIEALIEGWERFTSKLQAHSHGGWLASGPHWLLSRDLSSLLQALLKRSSHNCTWFPSEPESKRTHWRQKPHSLCSSTWEVSPHRSSWLLLIKSQRAVPALAWQEGWWLRTWTRPESLRTVSEAADRGADREVSTTVGNKSKDCRAKWRWKRK